MQIVRVISVLFFFKSILLATMPSCVQQKLHMRIQVVKSLVRADGGYLLCWGELDCYSCCATLPDALVRQMLQMPSSGGG